MFGVIWLALALGEIVSDLFLLGCLAFVVRIIILFWWMLFQFQIIQEAAAGEDNLPNPGLDNGAWEIVAAFFKWVGSWVVVMLPAIAFMIWHSTSGAASFLPILLQGIGGMIGSSTVLTMIILMALGMFMWPMVILCLALGGFSTLQRPDLLVRTIVKTFPAYLATVLLVFGSSAVEVAFQRYLQQSGPGAAAATTNTVGVRMLGIGFGIYVDIVALRCIGLYYHHFKNRFAWSWG